MSGTGGDGRANPTLTGFEGMARFKENAHKTTMRIVLTRRLKSQSSELEWGVRIFSSDLSPAALIAARMAQGGGQGGQGGQEAAQTGGAGEGGAAGAAGVGGHASGVDSTLPSKDEKEVARFDLPHCKGAETGAADAAGPAAAAAAAARATQAALAALAEPGSRAAIREDGSGAPPTPRITWCLFKSGELTVYRMSTPVHSLRETSATVMEGACHLVRGLWLLEALLSTPSIFVTAPPSATSHPHHGEPFPTTAGARRKAEVAKDRWAQLAVMVLRLLVVGPCLAKGMRRSHVPPSGALVMQRVLRLLQLLLDVRSSMGPSPALQPDMNQCLGVFERHILLRLGFQLPRESSHMVRHPAHVQVAIIT